jgi:SAM-dependent methyltransferase
MAASAEIEVDITCADLFSPPAKLENQFDIVVSIGVIEHFNDTAQVVRALSRFLRVGGILATVVPNIPGLVGTLFKRVNRPVYDIHVPLDAAALRAAHEHASLTILSCDYLMSLNLGIVNLVGLDPSAFSTRLKNLLLIGMIGFSRAVWGIERAIGALPVHPHISPYIAAVGPNGSAKP